MATKTITLEISAYDKLRRAKRAGESFSDVVRRATFSGTPASGRELLAWYRAGGSGAPLQYLDAAEEASRQDAPPEDPWK